MVDIREYYEDKSSSSSGNMMPGKKGISLPVAQFQTLVTLLPEIEVALKAKGEIVTRPDYGRGGDGDDGAEAEAEADGEEEEEEEEEKEEVKEKNNKKGKAKAGGKNSGKENFEATSEEE
ncbi:MAG: hypothetical protein L6R35_007210 [Caloplaca aegaea]|nr:MAG: hypothetical protein L6R35_007210 [Caloplaca aegaea]